MSKKSVMISYNHKSTGNLASKLNDSLKTAGFSTWIDIDKMRGNSVFSAMAKAVETSDVILIILSNEYCESDNCVRECEYAFNKDKYVVTVKGSAGYKPSGSVGLLTSSMLYIDFTKGNYDTQFDELLRTIVKKLNNNDEDYDYGKNYKISKSNIFLFFSGSLASSAKAFQNIKNSNN